MEVNEHTADIVHYMVTTVRSEFTPKLNDIEIAFKQNKQIMDEYSEIGSKKVIEINKILESRVTIII